MVQFLCKKVLGKWLVCGINNLFFAPSELALSGDRKYVVPVENRSVYIVAAPSEMVPHCGSGSVQVE